jgi:hypothetical protein
MIRSSVLLTLVLLTLAGCLVEKNPSYCHANTDCGPGRYCDVTAAVCRPAQDGGGDTAIDARDAADGALLGDARDAASEAPDTKTGCDTDLDCTDPAKPGCDSATRTCVVCARNANCSAPTPACDTTVHACVGCLGNGDCSAPTAVCNIPAQVCVGCLADTDCMGTTPICNTTAHSCRACAADAECATKLGADPGVCLGDGHCATSDEVIYAQGGASCPGAGTAASPYCDSQRAMSAVSSAKHVVVMRGTLGEWTLAQPGTPVVVVGQSSAKIAPVTAGAAGITINGADVLIRSVSVVSGTSGGLVANAGSTLRLYGCLVESNAGIGVQTAGAFQIENTVIAKNGGSQFAGVSIGPTTATPTVFRNNTVVQNGVIGVTCGAAYTISGNIVFGNGVAQLTPNCSAADSCATACSTMDPMLDETAGKYQLTTNSPAACIDVLDIAPPTDRKGTTRPQGPKSDCGADELVK